MMIGQGRRGGWIVLTVCLASLAACELDSTSGGPPRSVPEGFEELTLDGLALDRAAPDLALAVADDHRQPTSADDPCQCTTNECLEDWASENVGCNVCVTLICGVDRTNHVCSWCDDGHDAETSIVVR